MWITLLLYILQGKLKIITCFKTDGQAGGLIVRIFTNVLNRCSRASCRKIPIHSLSPYCPQLVNFF